jgi:MraZ protein
VAELLGTHSYQLDPKGRITLPSRFREAFEGGLYVTLGQDGCLYCFPRAEWDQRSGEVRSAPLSDADGRAYARMFFGSAEYVELDSQGRLLVPQRLRTAIGLKKEAVVLGVQDRMEIWDRAAYDRYSESFSGASQSGSLLPGRQA